MTPTRPVAHARPFVAGSLGLLLLMALGQPAAVADAENGALIFRRCAACHEIDERANRIGPHLVGVVGRTAGTVPDFNYSVALAGSGIVWTEANLDAFLADPRGFIPNNRMAFAGLDDPADRADVIAFLGGVPVPEPEPEPVEVIAVDLVAPLLARVAARFAAESRQIEPVVGESAADDAVAAFCAGPGNAAPDLLGLARRIRQAELDRCAARGVAAVTEIRLGHAAVVPVVGRDEPERSVDLPTLWQALASMVPTAAGLEFAPFARWPEVDPEQPPGDLPARTALPSNDLLEVLNAGMIPGCLAFPAVEALPEVERSRVCPGFLRPVPLTRPESAIPEDIQEGRIAFGLMSLAGFEAGRAAVQPLRINGVEPALTTIRDGSYALAQPLFLYVKPARIERQPGLGGYLAALTAEPGIAGEGDLGALGLVPLTRAEREAAREAARSLPTLSLGRPNLLPVPAIAPSNPVWAWASAAEMALRDAGLPALGEPGTYRCNVVAARFGSCQPDCAACLTPVATPRSLLRALDAYQEQALAQGQIDARAFEPRTAARLKPGALRRMIRNQRRPVLAQVLPHGRRSFYPAGMSSHFALIVGIAGTGPQARLTVNDPYPYPEAANPYLATGERTGEPGQYAIPYGDFRQRLGYRQSVVLR